MATTSVQPAAPTGAAKTKKRGPGTLERRQERWGFFFISPWIIGFLAFTLLPVAATFALSFTNYNPLKGEETHFVALDNYLTMLSDSKVGTSLLVTVRYGILAIPVGLAFGLLLATLVNSRHLAGKNIFRTLFFMPSMIPVVAGALVWAGVMNTQSGWINLILEAIGVPKGPDWLNDVWWIYPALVLIGLWGLGNLMLTLLAGMQGVPSELYEAARMDGASGFQQFWFITLPMISPVLFYNIIIGVIGAFKYFDLAYVLKNGTGGPADATLFYNLNLFKNVFNYNLYGYGSALAWGLFLIALAVTLALFNSSARWVYYAGEGRS